MLNTHLDNDGILTLTFQAPGNGPNVINQASMEAFRAALDQHIADPAVKGIILTSGKSDFIVGADIDMLFALTDAKQVFAMVNELNAGFRKLETCGKPVVAAINGTALGGGLELALACHYRISVSDPSVQIGLPEVMLGVLPGGGGTQRLPRLIGIQNALQNILQAKRLRPQQALKEGIVNQLVDSAEELLPAAKAYLLSGTARKVQPWDEKGYKVPGDAVQSPQGRETFTAGIALLRKQSFGNYPGPYYAMSAVYEGMQVPIEKGLLAEARYFTKAVLSKEAKHMMRTLWYHKNAAEKGVARPAGVGELPLKKVGVLGAGMMGAGIAYVSAVTAGLEVVLKDVTQESADKGKAYSENLLKEKLQKGYLSQDKYNELLGRIHATADPNAVAGSDLIVEAVFEERGLKARVTQESEAVLGEKAIFASNTSTLPITGLAEASQRPERFIGLHFFSPVEKMDLVEVIMGKQTGDEALALSIDYIRKLKKIPIVVNDSRGFFTSRVFATYVREGFFLLDEGVSPVLIENLGKAAGMPVAPLALADEVSIDLMHKIVNQTIKDFAAEGKDALQDPAIKLALRIGNLMVDEQGRLGKKARKGFYEYPEDAKKYLWPELTQHFPEKVHGLDHETIKKRLLHVQAVDSARCLEEGVLRNPQDGDIGSIFGWGFAPYTGGVLSYIDYVGVRQFVAECDAFAKQFGPRFEVPELLRKMAAENRGFWS
jgi:3-hydroxyacyl-CoA dehydrogenase/enoyl-CoA hydratase/3-hydroxybutyryl-CoA epimerase